MRECRMVAGNRKKKKTTAGRSTSGANLRVSSRKIETPFHGGTRWCEEAGAGKNGIDEKN